MSEVTLSSAVRSSLLNLQKTAELMNKTQERLATGLEVNSALDNPLNFFTAQSLNARAGDLGKLLDSISNAIQTVEAADNGISGITKLVESAQSIATQALQDKSNSSTTSETGTGGVNGATDSATALGSTLVGDIGLTAGDTIEITSSVNGVDSTYTYTVGGASDTVQDLVDGINGTGFLTASVDADGVLSINTDGESTLSTTISAADPDGDATLSNLATDAFTALGYGAPDSATDHAADGAGTDVATLDQAAAGAGASANRAALAEQFNSLLNQIDQLAEDSGFNGVNLLGGVTESLEVFFNEDGTSSITLEGVDVSSAGLGLTDATDFASDTEIKARLDSLQDALGTLRTTATSFGSNLSVVQIRQEFTKEMINTLETGAANLTLADTNEEGANMLALQTRQQLGSIALSLAAQADQNVLRLF